MIVICIIRALLLLVMGVGSGGCRVEYGLCAKGLMLYKEKNDQHTVIRSDITVIEILTPEKVRAVLGWGRAKTNQ